MLSRCKVKVFPPEIFVGTAKVEVPTRPMYPFLWGCAQLESEAEYSMHCLTYLRRGHSIETPGAKAGSAVSRWVPETTAIREGRTKCKLWRLHSFPLRHSSACGC